MAYSAELRREFKATARSRIREYFWPTMGAVVLGMLPALLGSVLYQRGQSMAAMLLYIAIAFFVVLPMQFGMMHFYVARSRGQETPVSTIFCAFGQGRTYRNALVIAIAIFIRSIGWYLLECVAIGVIAALLVTTNVIMIVNGSPMVADGSMAVLTVFVAGVALVVISAVVNVKIRRYDAAYVLMVDHPERSVWEATGECAGLFREHNWELFVFDLSFILWIIGTLFTFGILGIYYSAYQDMAYVRYVDALRQNKGEFTQQGTGNLPPLS